MPLLNDHKVDRFFLLATVIVVASPTVAQEKINWSVTPYLWATKTTYDLTADGSPVGAGTVNFNDLIDTTDASFQIAIEAGRDKGHWSLLTDITYIETSDNDTVDVPGVGALRIDTESEQIHADLALAYWPWSQAGGLSILGGIRYTDLDDETSFRLVDPDLGKLGKVGTDRDFTDALIGARYIYGINERWELLTRADYGFGDSEGIFQAHALIRYAVGSSRRNGILLGYRYKDSQFEDGELEEDYEYTGPVAGFNFRF